MKLRVFHEWHGSKTFDLWIWIDPRTQSLNDCSATNSSSRVSLVFESNFASYRACQPRNSPTCDSFAGITLPSYTITLSFYNLHLHYPVSSSSSATAGREQEIHIHEPREEVYRKVKEKDNV
ncbi:hypothetical protein AC578_4826 [Pseudocercospora eumusae]|uniref:Uncharacterized protein n=1 Tax=Pseudocercospora eumusae TaxID=321146 RepID=A0A139HLE8_9PEZI|nr:hypothetical protein AC578_4826 [Pseudocercospora eumusae]